jgi:hypothetical protein
VFTALDIEFLQTLGISVEVRCYKSLTETIENYDCTTIRTLFYLPHCDRTTNEAVLSSLFATNSLGNTIILGNDLRTYSQILTDSQLKSVAPSIYQVVNGNT